MHIVSIFIENNNNFVLLEIALISKANEQNKLILASLFGNTNLKCNGIDESATVLKYGLKIDDQYNMKSKMMRSTLTKSWSEDYHSFVLSWSPGNIVFKIDGESNYLDMANLPLDLFDSDVKTTSYFIYKCSILIFIYNFLVLYFHYFVSWWHDKFP